MLLAIDSGNTNIVYAVFSDDGEIVCEWRASSDPNRTPDEMGVWLFDLMKLEGVDPKQVTAAIIATVVPAILYSLKTLCRKYFGCEPRIIGDPALDLGLKVIMDRPEEVGADRLVNAVAAHEKYGGPLIVLDFGTATTFDVIDGDGNYNGGVIAPGINLSLEALHTAAAKLQPVAIEKPQRIIGKGTAQAMQSGIFWGYVCMIEGLVERISEEFGSSLDVVATGGLAPLFAQSVECIKHSDPDLTLRGLYSIYLRNLPK